MSKSPPLIGRLAVHHKLITMDQLAEATREQGRHRDGTRLGDIFIELGMLTTEQVRKLALAQKKVILQNVLQKE